MGPKRVGRAAVVLSLLLAAPAAFANQRLSADGGVGTLRAFGETAAWLDPRDDGSGRRAELVITSGTRVKRTKVRISPSASLDVGPLNGRAQVVYSRCVQNDDCELFRYDPKRRREFKLRRTSSPNCRETVPSLWRTTVVFYRDPIHARDVPKCRAGIYRQTGKGRPELLRPVDPRRRPADGYPANQVSGLETRREALAFTLTRQTGTDDEEAQVIWARPSDDARFTAVARGETWKDRPLAVSLAGIVGSRVYWTRQTGSSREYSADADLYRQPLTSGAAETTSGDFGFSAAVTGTNVFYSDRTGVYRAGFPTWEGVG